MRSTSVGEVIVDRGIIKAEATRSSVMGSIAQIWIKRAHGGVMDRAAAATLVAGRGIVGNADQRGRRQVTLIARERWDELMEELGANVEPSARRANVVLVGIDL